MIGKPSLPRPLHPFAWWLWAILLSVAAHGTTNPLLLGAIVAVACLVTFSRRGDNPWAKGFVVYLVLGLFVVVMRIGYRVLFGGGDGPTVLFHLPRIGLPWWAGGIRLLGPVSLEAVLAGAYDGARLATVIICLGAANSLANPKRLLASLPGALYEAGTILVVAVNVFPQLGASALRVTRARKLRRPAGDGRRQRYRVVESVVVPVLSDALDRSLALAASMDARGYGRHGDATLNARRWTTAIGLTGLAVMALGIFGYLSRLMPGPVVAGRFPVVPLSIMAAGVGLVAWAMHRAGQTVTRTRYRSVRWRAGEWITVASGLAAVAALEVTRGIGDGAVLTPTFSPPVWPELPPLLLAGIALAAVPAFATPAPALADTRLLTAQEGLS